MKPSTTLRKASVYHDKANALIDSLNDHLTEVLEDDQAHVSFSNDGIVIVFMGEDQFPNTSPISNLDVDAFFKIKNKEKALKILNRISI